MESRPPPGAAAAAPAACCAELVEIVVDRPAAATSAAAAAAAAAHDLTTSAAAADAAAGQDCVVLCMGSDPPNVVDSVPLDVQETFTLESFGDLVDSRRLLGAPLILARTQSRAANDSCLLTHSVYEGISLCRLLFKESSRGTVKHRYHAARPITVKNPLTNSPIVGEVEFYIVRFSEAELPSPDDANTEAKPMLLPAPAAASGADQKQRQQQQQASSAADGAEAADASGRTLASAGALPAARAPQSFELSTRSPGASDGAFLSLDADASPSGLAMDPPRASPPSYSLSGGGTTFAGSPRAAQERPQALFIGTDFNFAFSSTFRETYFSKAAVHDTERAFLRTVGQALASEEDGDDRGAGADPSAMFANLFDDDAGVPRMLELLANDLGRGLRSVPFYTAVFYGILLTLYTIVVISVATAAVRDLVGRRTGDLGPEDDREAPAYWFFLPLFAVGFDYFTAKMIFRAVEGGACSFVKTFVWFAYWFAPYIITKDDDFDGWAMARNVTDIASCAYFFSYSMHLYYSFRSRRRRPSIQF